MYKAPWAKLMTPSMPKISVSPDASKNSSMPKLSPIIMVDIVGLVENRDAL
jgi:hypothetical protein